MQREQSVLLRSSKVKCIVAIVFFLTIASHSYSQGMRDSVFRIKTVDVFAKRLFKKEEAGMKETQVDSSVLMEKMNSSLSELLSENTSVFIKSNGRGALATASFRGTAASHVQVKWNGININSPMLGMVDFSLIPVYIIDDLNLKHGGASIADQSGGLGGSINIGNRVDWNKKFNVKYLQGIGSYNTFDEFLQVGGGNKKLQFNTRVYHNYSKNDYPFINRSIQDIDTKTGEVSNPSDKNDHADFTKYGILQEVYYRPSQNNIISAKYWGQWADRTIPRPTSYEGPENSNLNNQIDHDNKFVVDWKHFSDKSKLTLRSGYSDKKLDYTLKNFVIGRGPTLAIDSRSKEQSLFNTVEIVHDFTHDFSIEASVNANYYDVVSHESVKKTGYEEKRLEVSGFLSIRKSFANRLNLNLMLRQDWVDDGFVPFIPFLGFDYRIIRDKNFIFKGNISRNYHQPSLNDLYWQPGGNPDLLAEDGVSAELGIEYRKRIRRQNLEAELTAYRSDIDNWIIWIPNYKGFWEPHNVKRVLSQGLEGRLSVNGRIGKMKYRFSGTYTFTPSVNYGEKEVWGDASYGKQLVYVPLHSSNVIANISYAGFFVTYQFNHYSERFTTSSNKTTRRDWLYPYIMNDLVLGKKIQLGRVKLSAELKVYNLFNETYHSVLYRPMPGRNYMALLIFNI